MTNQKETHRIMYHGTNEVFEKFKPDYLFGKNSIDQYGSGYYFYPDPARTVRHGDFVVFANCHIKKVLHYAKANKIYLTFREVEQLICKSPNLDYHLENFGDLHYEGFDHVLSKTCEMYTGQDILHTLNAIGNDFFAPGKETEILLTAFTQLTGYNSIHIEENNIWVMLNAKDIEIIKVIHNEELE